MRLVSFAVAVFSFTGLVGPALRLATWPPSTLDATARGTVSYFLYFFTLFLWPTFPIVTFVPNVATATATGLAIGTNVLVFAAAGLLVGVAGLTRWLPLLALSCLAAIGLLLALPLVWFPSGLDSITSTALAAAVAVYSSPCAIVLSRRLRLRPNEPGPTRSGRYEAATG